MGGQAAWEDSGTSGEPAYLDLGLPGESCPSACGMQGPRHCRALGRQTEETEGKEGTRPLPQPRLTPRVGPKGHGPIALHQMRPLKAVFVLETAVWHLGLGARGAGSRSVASRAVAPDELAERQQQGAEERPRSSLGTPPPGNRHLGFWDAEAGGRGRGSGAADGQQGAH